MAGPISMRILTHNIRYAIEEPEKGEESWNIRCPRLCSELVFNSMNNVATFICLQEVLLLQLVDIQVALNRSDESADDWHSVGVGREDGKHSGEYSPIFYRASIWSLVDWSTVWLSETPDRPSRGWDAASTRIMTIAEFKHRETHQTVVIMNTHLDDQGASARAESARLILRYVGKLEQGDEDSIRPRPVILAGDFNSPPEDVAYKIMTDGNSGMVEASTKIDKSKRYGHKMTFTSFDRRETPSRIDFVFCNKDSGVSVGTYAVLENQFDDGVFLSDHRAVVIDLDLSH
ncbi:MAG: hypothetical protein M1818_005654 [Claussenomyces sp. TS43310]|nr:MAG: hypothetical protein M1818_005654 [Claussenomyces sp. TS43310]